MLCNNQNQDLAVPWENKVEPACRDGNRRYRNHEARTLLDWGRPASNQTRTKRRDLYLVYPVENQRRPIRLGVKCIEDHPTKANEPEI